MTDKISVQEYRKMAKRPKSKYKNRKVEHNGQMFDSKRELSRYKELVIMIAHGIIFNLCRQVKFELIPAQYTMVDGKMTCIEKACSYYADFVYQDHEGKKIAEDSKGVRTTDYIIKKKLMLHVHGIQIKEV